MSNCQLTHVFSAIDVILGAYGETGRDEFDGEPKPDIPETEYLLLAGIDMVGRVGGNGVAPLLLHVCWLDVSARAGGVVAP
jgi:hypothetical protein